ncbi:hypothetical protein G9A89_019955 [Geosiphon pyriformis]|nr:hypothetical protein G9A89_019955 [Geosiphon pyriformis]
MPTNITEGGKVTLKSSFKVSKTIEVIYTGGKVVISPDERLLITTVGEDIEVTNFETRERIYQLKGDTEVVTTFAITTDSRYLISASRSLALKIWDLTTGKMIRSFKAHEAPILVMDVDITSTLVATGSADSTVKVWDIARGYCTHNFRGHGGVISALKFYWDPKKPILVSGADDCKIRIWNLMESSCIGILDSHFSIIRGLDFSNDGRYLLSGSRDKVVIVWDLEKKCVTNTFPIFETIEAIGVLEKKSYTFTSENDESEEPKELFYTAGEKGIIRIWDMKTGKLIIAQDQETNITQKISDIIYTRKSGRLVTVTYDQNILVYDISAGLKCVKHIIGYNDEIIDIVYIGNDESHIAIATNTEQIRVYDVETLGGDIIYGHEDIVFCLDKSPDGKILVSGSKDNTARVWGVDFDEDRDKRFKCLGICIGHTEAIGAIAMSKRSSKFCITGSRDRTIKCWDLSSFKDGENTRLKALYTHQAHDKDINAIAVSPNDKHFASGSQDKTAKIWSVQDGSLIGTLKGHKRGVWSVQFSPVDQSLATSSGDKSIKIWSLNDFSCLKTFEGHTNTVLKVSFITSGTQIISSGSDGLVKLWTIKSEECVTTLDNHSEKIWALTVRKDEKFVVSGGADSLINFWEDYTIEEMEEQLKEEEELILREQDLSNFLLQKDYKNAITLAMTLKQPFRLLKLFSEVLASRPPGDKSITGAIAIDNIIASLDDEQLKQLLGYIRDWNTNAKHLRTAQTILNTILNFYPAAKLSKIKGIKEILDGLIPYSERHFQRLDSLITDSFILDYTLQAMDLWNPTATPALVTDASTAIINPKNMNQDIKHEEKIQVDEEIPYVDNQEESQSEEEMHDSEDEVKEEIDKMKENDMSINSSESCSE